MEDKQKLYIFGGVGVVVLLVILLRKSGSGATVIQSPPSVPSMGPNETLLAQRAQDNDLFKTITGLVYANKAAETQTNAQLAQIEASRQVGLAQTSAATDVAKAQNSLQQFAITAARDVGLAQANADSARQRMILEAQADQLSAQNRNNLVTAALSSLGNILKNLLGQPQPKPSGSSGGVSAGSGGGATAPTRTNPLRRNPALPQALTLDGVDLAGLTGYFGGPPDVYFPEWGGSSFPSGFQDFAPDIPAFIPQVGTGGFYVEDPMFTPGGFGDLPFAGQFGDPFAGIDPGYGLGFGPYNPVPDFGPPPGDFGSGSSGDAGFYDFGV